MKKLATFAAVLLLTGCAMTSETPMQEDVDFPTLVKQANESIKKAKSVDGEWRDSKSILKDAEKAAKSGEMDKAMKLAKTAKMQGEMGYSQAISEKNAGPWLF